VCHARASPRKNLKLDCSQSAATARWVAIAAICLGREFDGDLREEAAQPGSCVL
jgi:hypothetical protein